MNYSTALLIGRRQTGKTTFLAQAALDAIHAGDPVALFDPYGTATELVLSRIPEERWRDVVLIEPDFDHPVAFNPLYNIEEKDFSRTKDKLKHTLKSVWDYTDFPTPTLDDILSNGITAILYARAPSLVSLKWFLTSSKRRKRMLRSVRDIGIRDFWENDFERMTDRQKVEETRSTLTKLRAFTSDAFTRNILGQAVSRIDMDDVLEGKILLVDLSISKVGIEASKLLGSLLMAELHQAALAHRGPFHCFVDGADRFAQSVQVEMAEMTSGASYMFAITHLGQVGERLREALIGASDAYFAFTTGTSDQRALQPVFLRSEHENNQNLLHELRRFEICVNANCHEKPIWDRVGPLGYAALPKAPERIRHLSRERYARQRKDVEAELKRFVGNS